MNCVIIGTGLIGGSVARDLRASGLASKLIGVESDPAAGQEAVALGLVDEVRPLFEAVGHADLVFLAIPVGAIMRVLPEVLDMVADHAVVVDGGSTKHAICKLVEFHPRRSLYVAAHPIAGTENSGPSAALEGLFRGKTNIVCDSEKTARGTLEKAMVIFDALGMQTVFMEAEEHDRHVAYVSHLSHVSSFLLGRTVLDIEKDEKNIFNLAGSGFASTVRLAKSSPEMWAPIFEQNQEFLSQALLEYIMHLQRFHYLLMKRDQAGLLQIMKEANSIRRVLDGIELKQNQKTNL